MRKNQQYLLFRLRGVRYGIALESCQEVSLRFKIDRIPRSQPHMAGIMNLRGEVVGVIDLGVLLESGASSDKGAVIRLKSKEQSLAFRVDMIEDILNAEAESLGAPPPHLSEAHLKLMAGVLQTREGIVQIVDPQGILNV